MEERKIISLEWTEGKLILPFTLQMKTNITLRILDFTELRKRYAHPETRPGGDDGGWARFVPSSGGLAGG